MFWLHAYLEMEHWITAYMHCMLVRFPRPTVRRDAELGTMIQLASKCWQEDNWSSTFSMMLLFSDAQQGTR